jgi:hypothetical protein
MRIALVLVILATLAPAIARADCSAEHKRARALRETLASVGEATAEYRAMLARKIEEAEAAAATCERAAAAAKRSAEALAVAKKRELEAQAKKDAEDRFAIDEMRSQAEFLRIAWSAHQCSYEKERDAVLSNPFASAEQKEALKRTEVMLTRIRATMKRGKIVALPCRTEDVAKLAFCVSDESANPACAQGDLALRVRAERKIIAAVQLEPLPAPLTPAEEEAKGEVDDAAILQPDFDR